MSVAASELQSAKDWLANEPVREQSDCLGLVTHLERFVDLFRRTSRDEHRAMMSEFHNCAGRFPYFQDSDIGALILESAADTTADTELRMFLYSEAKLRAIWCAQGASAGGEGMARMVHVRRLEDKLR